MAFVQRAHGGDKSEALVALPGVAASRAGFVDGGADLQLRPWTFGSRL
jgi:hypothetical protein